MSGALWALKFDKFSEFQNVIGNSFLSTLKRRYDTLRTKSDMWITPKQTRIFYKNYVFSQSWNNS